MTERTENAPTDWKKIIDYADAHLSLNQIAAEEMSIKKPDIQPPTQIIGSLGIIPAPYRTNDCLYHHED